MTLIQQLLDELDREAARTQRALEQVPAGRDAWKPHDKSMALGRLAGMIATMPAWIVLILKQDELDLTPPGGGEWKLPSQNELVAAHHKSVADARDALNSIDDTLLLTTNWRLRAGGQVDIPVTANDVSPRGERLQVLPEVHTSGARDELAFVNGDMVRYLAPSAEGEYIVNYSVFLGNEPSRIDTITISADEKKYSSLRRATTQ